MKRTVSFGVIAIAAVGILFSGPSAAGEQDAIDGCIDRLRTVGGPDARSGGEVLNSEFSEAATLVMLRDAGGTVWRCLAYSDGTVAELAVSEAADDGGGAMAGAPHQSGGEPTTESQRVHFERGATGAELTGRLTPGSSMRYILGAKNRQDLYVRVAAKGPDVFYQILNPDGTFLLEQMTLATEYRGQLWQSGDHVVEVINRGKGSVSYNIIIGAD